MFTSSSAQDISQSDMVLLVPIEHESEGGLSKRLSKPQAAPYQAKFGNATPKTASDDALLPNSHLARAESTSWPGQHAFCQLSLCQDSVPADVLS